ncbi:ABC transporter permease [Parapedobacter sp. ISTM3]|uniref:ABC transporter permease n=1 Tax=Parapedobacter sp. ISTM3 TaxID=2800130 RepID=UPI0019070616|nr:ABC transporter permease [Parapedobacter sp. ISTM3]MBK1441167.1 ABC transporter permease [Parapedobacter sp. ISTM3]
MIRNYLKIAWRNLIRDKRTSLINISGLSLGIAAALILFVVIQYEWSFDRFHKNYQRVYRVVTETQYGNSSDYNQGVAAPLAKALSVDMPQLEAVVPLYASGGQVNVTNNANHIDKYSELALFTSAGFFHLFDATWLAGNAEVLANPNHVVLDRETASRYFGSWQAAVGRDLVFANEIPLKVAGVVENARENSNFPYRLLVSFPTLEANTHLFDYGPDDWKSVSSSTQLYILLGPQHDAHAAARQLDVLTKKYFDNQGASTRILHLQPLSNIHFDARYGTIDHRQINRSTLTTLALIGVFILLMAAINFVNLSTAQALGKGKEIGVRKVLGGSRGSLIAQSFGETFLLVLIALLVAVALAYGALPYIHHLSNMPDNPDLLQTDTLIFLLLSLLALTFLSGLYPALVTSGFKPVIALKNKINTSQIGGVSLRKGLVAVQFAIAQLLMIGTLVAVKQMAFIRDADLGFDQSTLYTIQVPSDGEQQRMPVFKQQLLQLPNVKSVSFASDVPSSDNKWSSNFYVDGDTSDDIDFPAFLKFADADYFESYGLSMAAGRPYVASDTLREAVINETMVQRLGLASAADAIGRRIRIGFASPWMTISGVVKDYTPNSLREEISPIIMGTDKSRYYVAGVKLEANAGRKTLNEIKQQFEALYPEHYYEASFLDDTINKFYEQEEKMATAYQFFAILSIIISSIGLYGIVSFMLGQKVKEIGIRKVLGASVTSIVYLFSKEFIYLVGIAFFVAMPLAYYFMQDWLNGFAYRIDLSAWLFLAVMLAALAIALTTIGVRVYRAAIANPVESLRDE